MDFSEFLRAAERLISNSSLSVRVVVMFDEIEHLIIADWADSFFANWRALLSNTPSITKNFGAVFSGAKEMFRLQDDVGSPLMDSVYRFLRQRSPNPLRMHQCYVIHAEGPDKLCADRQACGSGKYRDCYRRDMQCSPHTIEG